MNLFKVLLATLLFAFAGASFAADVVDINRADATQLETLNGIGPAKAAAIIEYREANGPFATVEDLANVKGIGLRTVELNRASMSVGDAAAPAAGAGAEQPKGD
jgi:competence protein ComEA